MVITIDIPDRVVAQAAAQGKSVAELVSDALDHIPGPPPVPTEASKGLPRGTPPPGFVWLGPPKGTPEDAAAAIRQIASQNTLGGLKIKNLIEEDRRF
jgi:hypothetical protein